MIRDILHRLEGRCPTRVIIWPVPVQGEGAAAKIAEAIRGFGAIEAGGQVPRPDLLIVARGGGSMRGLGRRCGGISIMPGGGGEASRR